ncbi:glycosyltransferase [Chryseobacterium sp. ISL-80]|nr:glycosyltransferase [Chryseobacterium sp. ISL-80]
MPFLSIIVPVYQVEKYLSRCINSIINQDYDDFELILVNDGSPDSSGIICDSYAKLDKRIRVIHKKNGGLGSARNAGLKVAKGMYVGFVDSDDWITPDMYTFLIEIAKTYNADIVASSYILTKGSTDINQINHSIKCFVGEEKLKYYLESGMKHRVADYSVCNKIYNLRLFQGIKFPEGQFYEDVATNYKLIKSANKFIKSDKITYFYFQDSSSITRNGFKKQDHDLLLVSKELVALVQEEANNRLIEIARMKEARAYFSMLSKIVVYGFQDNVEDSKEITKWLTKNLRENYILLLKSPMPLNRKIIMTLLCINKNIIKIPFNIYQQLINRV